MKAALSSRENDTWRVEGDIDYVTVTALRAEGERVMEAVDHGATLCFDFAGVRQVNTAGLSLLLCWRRWAARHGLSLELVNLPDELRAIARISDLEALLESSKGAAGSG
ncbi:lipid asymmetry maintenance protein MlaB [Motiliproteus sp. SC1-56]|uniref:STAS domain-containing protein n=1 Tax=Motiliproteus sp. SC1-56 TaxID=2799565 RepID=UPI001A8F408A|nr:STAS domain-containing protein [Motiliproteus sp. SC1-56]